jgi:flavocytochrome c
MTREKETTRRVSRRDFVKGAAAGATILTGAGALAACGTTAAPGVAPGVPESWDRETDVVIVGYGGAGATAAIAARDAGAEVLILEKREVPGGITAICGGVFYAAGTSVQKDNGIDDSADLLYQHYLNSGEGLNDPAQCRIAADMSAANIDLLIELGATFPDPPSVSGAEVPAGSEPIARVHRVAYGDLAGGAAYFRVLADGAENKGAEILMETPAKSLVTDADGQVIGVRAESGGEELLIKARKAVIITAGGFTRNKQMLADYTADGYYCQPLGVPDVTGDGIRMAIAIGADVGNMSQVLGIAGLTLPGASAATYAPTGASILVNIGGRRFVDETWFYDWKNDEILQQPEHRCYAIFDDAMKEEGAGQLLFDQAPDLVFQADSVGDLAAQIGVDADELEATVEAWNAGVEAEEDGLFGRTGNLVPIETGPFYAFEVFPTMFDNSGGLKINTEARVLNVWGEEIPRLFAAGNMAAGVIGEHYPGSGTSLNQGMAFGLIAGEKAAAEEPWS